MENVIQLLSTVDSIVDFLTRKREMKKLVYIQQYLGSVAGCDRVWEHVVVVTYAVY